MKWIIRVTAPGKKGFCAGIIKGDAAPILRKHVRGKTVAQIREYCKRKGWTFELLNG